MTTNPAADSNLLGVRRLRCIAESQARQLLSELSQSLYNRRAELSLRAEVHSVLLAGYDARKCELESQLSNCRLRLVEAAENGEDEKAEECKDEMEKIRLRMQVWQEHFLMKLDRSGCSQVTSQLVADLFSQAVEDFVEDMLIDFRVTANHVTDRAAQ